MVKIRIDEEGYQKLVSRDYVNLLKLVAVSEGDDIDIYIGDIGSYRELVRGKVGKILGGCSITLLENVLYLGGNPMEAEIHPLHYYLREVIANKIQDTMNERGMESPNRVVL